MAGVVPSEISLEDLFKPTSQMDLLADKLAGIAAVQIETSLKYKRSRMEEVQKSLDLYYGVTKKALKGRWNVPLPLMSGYADTLLSKTDDAPKVNFGYQDPADMPRAAKVQAKFDDDSSEANGMWAAKDRLEKHLAIFYGVGIKKFYAYNDVNGMYQSQYEVVDPMDFECEPMGGQMLRAHKFMGQRNIFKTESELKAGAMGSNPIYDKRQVLKLIATLNSDDYKKLERTYLEKTDRLKMLGFNQETHNYVGYKVYNFTEWYMEHEGVWYYMLFDPHTKIWVRCEELSSVFGSGVPPFVAWHTHRDAFNFWSKAPADDMRPVAEAMNVVFNQMLDAREKNTYAQRGYDPEMIEDAAQLEWRPDGLVAINTNGGTQPISSSVYQFRVEGMTEAGTINLMEFLDNITGNKTGVTASAQGESDEKRVGIYYGNLQQVADRLGLYNKSYSEAWARFGWLYYWGLRDHIKTNRMMVRMIGEAGYNWVELTMDDTDPEREFNITITGGQAELAQGEIDRKERKESLAAILSVPDLVAQLNPRVTVEMVLQNGMWKDDQIRRLLTKTSDGSEELIAEAHQAIQDILQGRTPKLNRGATLMFMQTILDFATDSEDLDTATYEKLLAYADLHKDTVIFNLQRKANMAMIAQGAIQAQPGQLGAPASVVSQSVPGQEVIPGDPSGSFENISFDEAATGISASPTGDAMRSQQASAGLSI